MRSINKVIVHCSATPNHRDIKTDEIRRWHVEDNGWDDIGYHYVIERDGSINNGRPVSKKGAHCYGQNHDSIGICLVGNDQFMPKQFLALQALYDVLKNIFPILKVYGHRDFTDKKTCPNFSVKDVLR